MHKMNITYRDASVNDFSTIIQIFVKNMSHSVFTKATDKDVLSCIAAIQMAEEFHIASCIKIAEWDGEICGVLIGATDASVPPAVSFDYNAMIRDANIKLTTTSEGQMVLTEMLLHNKNVKFESECEVILDCDGELMFFAVNQEYRRYKIGSCLVKNFEEFLQKCGSKKYFLHTDSQSTFQYYENNGFECVWKKQSIFNSSVEHYTYVKELGACCVSRS
ncbi:unknown protein [Desulfotalea psychrophila LSv54]|uniref:N-acetyltransferase domain-containing protein n=2 Tax=Desulfotalea psychrophila TaxID=84980 RepID=Q6ALF6_DESPS|nr:unknown protein [Desulfotalea psychrophila LSv54]